MAGRLAAWLERFRPNGYRRRQPLVLINGLAEQSETWFRNHDFWRRQFDVYMPNLLVYEGERFTGGLRGTSRSMSNISSASCTFT